MDLNVATEFYRRPLGRDRSQGTYTGEAFRDDVLIKKINSLAPNEKLDIDFTGVTMSGSSFLEEAFGGLVRKCGFKKDYLKKILVFNFPRRPSLESKVWSYINDALTD